ncbi:hypothetical protein FB381_2528 [Nocardioides albertanoniae]|uniref:Uncharacterized protein n=1 Tax=Nocardioides albertanoniae TaxID=1175486 RepID=A0A543A7P9_9ACTN|nr:hypothetical protein [Nocardioides albertanoniae]TQL68632.1 hypothetical protein FB381_2528 [Nocardioides albertanoniae]
MDPESARRSAAVVGMATLPIGAAILLAPDRVGRALMLGDHPVALRVIGAADLALVPGLLAGRRRLPWMAARAGLNVAIAAYCLHLARREGNLGPKVVVPALAIATAADVRTIQALRRTAVGT